uniref:Protein kinase C and casein kinase substrate in neurons 1b n=1 Tax=Echeneis naucrates TaxID=173247 RepID=A0A665SXP7_ECHNA
NSEQVNWTLFWQVGNYKRTVKRIDDGHRLCNDLMNCIQERAKIEKAYAQQLTEWSKRWRQLVEKGPQYGTVERAWLAVMTEAEKVSERHQDVKNNLINDDFEKVKNWQKDSYHKQMMGGFKETKEAEEGFKKAQKPWAKKLKELEAAKKSYHMACKEEKLASTREANSKGETSLTADQQKKLHEKVDKCKQDSQKAREKYEKALDELNKCTPHYMENMEQVFTQCQQFEEKRLSFLREVLLDVKCHLNLTDNERFETFNAADTAQEDLKWFSNNHGPGMHMNWPQFEVRIPSQHDKEKSKKSTDVMLTGINAVVDHAQAGDRGSICKYPYSDILLLKYVACSVSSYDKNQAHTGSTEWSDEDQTAPNSGNDTNGGTNPFDEDAVKGVRVRALYDYDGQEQDELSFRAGDELTKLEEEDEQGWCKGRLDNGQLGLYPANYVEPI